MALPSRSNPSTAFQGQIDPFSKSPRNERNDPRQTLTGRVTIEDVELRDISPGVYSSILGSRGIDFSVDDSIDYYTKLFSSNIIINQPIEARIVGTDFAAVLATPNITGSVELGGFGVQTTDNTVSTRPGARQSTVASTIMGSVNPTAGFSNRNK